MADENKDAKESGPGEGKAEAKTKVTDGPAEQGVGQLNPSAPGNTGTTPGTNAKVG